YTRCAVFRIDINKIGLAITIHIRRLDELWVRTVEVIVLYGTCADGERTKRPIAISETVCDVLAAARFQSYRHVELTVAIEIRDGECIRVAGGQCRVLFCL